MADARSGKLQQYRGRVALDQMRAVDKRRLIQSTGALAPLESQAVLKCLAEMFAP
jgi:mRNA-degrading endonuclease toxin of MazEF toxin-antitoxin module